MRPADFAKVLFIALAVIALRSESAPAQSTSRTIHLGRNGARVSATPDDTPLFTQVVTGKWQGTTADAMDDALKQARGHVLNFLDKRKPPIEWEPDIDYVRQRLVRDLTEADLKARDENADRAEIQKTERTPCPINGHEAVEERREFKEQSEENPIGAVRRVVLKVVVTAHDIADIQQKEEVYQTQNRHTQAEARQLLLGKVLLAFIAVLAAVGGYFRLEDATKGYYTAWLRLAAVGFVALVGVGIWYFS